MSFYDQNRPFGTPMAPPAAPQNGDLSWEEAAYYKRINGDGFHPPPHMRGMTLAELEARAREESRGAREAEEARQSAARIEAAPKSIERALLDPPSPKRAMSAQRGWRQRVRFLNQFKRCGSYREAAARIGVDESTVRRWRAKFPAFRARCDAILAERFQEKSDDLKLRAGQPRTRPYFFKGKQIGEQVIHDDRALMFLLKLEDAQRARAEAREERLLQRAHEIRLKEMEIEARRAATPAPEMHASAAHPAAPVEGEEASEDNDLPAVPADIAPPQVVEVEGPDTALRASLSSTEQQPHAEEAAQQPSRSMGHTPVASPSFETRAARAPQDEVYG